MPRLIFDGIQGLLEAPSVALFGFRQSLKPVGDFVESFVPRAAGHARIHVGIFVGLTGDRGTQVVARRTNRLSGGGISRFLEIFEMPVRVPGLALRSGTENSRNVILVFDVSLLSKIQVTTIGLRFTSKRVFEILFRLGTCK